VTTPKEVAQWMVAQLEESDCLLQVEAVAGIEKMFGSEFVYLSDIGEKSIDRRVLNHFRTLTGEDVVWVTQHGGGYWSGAHWRKRGGFILWHSCGHVKAFVEMGAFNDLMPEILETLSERPVGNLPSLQWAREKLDPKIATKGNLPLNILLQGSTEDVRADVRRIRAQTAGTRHIVGLTDDLLKNTPLANALAFVDEARKP